MTPFSASVKWSSSSLPPSVRLRLRPSGLDQAQSSQDFWDSPHLPTCTDSLPAPTPTFPGLPGRLGSSQQLPEHAHCPSTCRSPRVKLFVGLQRNLLVLRGARLFSRTAGRQAVVLALHPGLQFMLCCLGKEVWPGDSAGSCRSETPGGERFVLQTFQPGAEAEGNASRIRPWNLEGLVSRASSP